MAPFPLKIAPMKATPGDLPSGAGWSFEVKWDGMRLLAHINDGLTLRTSTQIDTTARFPELAKLPDVFGGKSAVVDGEVVALDGDGRPSFEVLQQRMHITEPREVQRRAAEIPAAFQVFDLLHFDGHDLTGLPLVDRRKVLHSVLDAGSAWRVTTVHEDGVALLAVAGQQHLEGIVAKRDDSTYRPGSRSAAWRKVKIRRHQEFVVGGWSPGAGQRSNHLGSLLVGFYDQGSLRYAGRVGTGFSSAELKRLIDKLTPLVVDADPFAPAVQRPDAHRATFVRPELVVEVAYAEWTSARRLRHPAYLGERLDVDPRSVTIDA